MRSDPEAEAADRTGSAGSGFTFTHDEHSQLISAGRVDRLTISRKKKSDTWRLKLSSYNVL